MTIIWREILHFRIPVGTVDFLCGQRRPRVLPKGPVPAIVHVTVFVVTFPSAYRTEVDQITDSLPLGPVRVVV